MGDVSSPQTTPAQTAEHPAEKPITAGLDPSAPKSAPTPASSRQHPPPIPQSFQGQPDPAFSEQFDRRYGPSSPAGESGPFFNMEPMASALPHGGYQHPPPGGHRQYNQQTSPPIMQHMPHNPYVGHHHGSMMIPGYFVQQPQMHQYYAANASPSHHGPHPMQGQGNHGYYPVPFVMEHPQSPGYYPQPPQFPDPTRQRPDHMMNRQYSQGHIQHEGRSQPRRPSNRTNRSFRDQNPPSGTLEWDFSTPAIANWIS